MGLLTTIVISNDQLHDVVKNPKELAKLIESHASGGSTTIEKGGIKLFTPRHGADKTIYIQMDGAVL